VSDRVGRSEPTIEMNAFDKRIDTQDFQPVPLRLDNGRIIANADGHPVWRRRELSLNSRDELALGEVGNGHFA
jgi:hypothetical protein